MKEEAEEKGIELYAEAEEPAMEVKPTPRRLLTADDILGADDRRSIDVEVPEWGGIVTIRSFMADELVRFWEDNKKDGSKLDGVQAARLVARSAVNEAGKLIFTEEHVAKLRRKSSAAMFRLQRAIFKLNGLDDESKEATKND